MTTTPTRRWLGATLAAALAVTAGCTSSASRSGPEVFRDAAVAASQFRLVSFDSCDEAAANLRAAARNHVGPWGFGWYGDGVRGFGGDAEEAAAGAEMSATVPDAPSATPDYSSTNVHEAGVEEPDLWKTDGRRIVTVHRGTLRVVDARRGVETGSLRLLADGWQPADLLLYGDQALVLAREGWRGRPIPIEPGIGAADDALPSPPEVSGPRLTLVDLSGAPRILSEYSVDGGLIDARQVGSVARVVVRSQPRMEFPWLEHASDTQRLAANRAAIDATELTDWLPRYQVTTADETRTGHVDCTAVSRPETYTGTSMLTVLTFDLAADSLGDGSPVSVVADGDTVYSNGTSLYVASDRRWRIGAMPMDGRDRPRTDDRTEIYKFDVSQPGPPRHVASGAVAGRLINQYAMSEWDGRLRVATTSGEAWWGEEAETESAVYALTQRGEALVEVGSVGGLGKGERIYSVRFTGSVGYVVTFRETDPLYTVDLSDPSAPTVLGELKITGYSAYLHPLDEGRLIGVGQEADLRGRVQGTQVSLFDVSDLTDPTLLAQHHVRYGHSEAEFDPHAFLWWPAERMLVVPLTVHDWRGGDGGPDAGALVLRVSDSGFTQLGVVSHPNSDDWGHEIRRSLVIGDVLWTLSDLGLQANSLSTLEQITWLPLR